MGHLRQRFADDDDDYDYVDYGYDDDDEDGYDVAVTSLKSS